MKHKFLATRDKHVYRRVIDNPLSPCMSGTTYNWYQIDGVGWLYGQCEVRNWAKLFPVQFCYW